MASCRAATSIRRHRGDARLADTPGPRRIGSGGRTARAIGAVVVAVLAAGCVGEPPEVTTDDPELVTGRAVYGASCASCHGVDGGGGAGSRLRDGAMITAYPDIDDQIDLVTNGRDRMPAYTGRLTEEEIRAVVRYTREVL